MSRCSHPNGCKLLQQASQLSGHLSVAAEILAAANQTISLKECAFLADKGCDVKSICNTVKSVYEGEAFLSLSIRAVRKSLKRFLPAIRSARPGLPCTRTEKQQTMDVPARNTAAPSASPKPAFALVTTKAGTTGRKTGAARNTRPFPMITGFPLTADAFLSSGRMPCGQSVSATILASNPQVRNGFGFEMAQARRTSTH